MGGAENMAKSRSRQEQQASMFGDMDQDEQEQLAIIKASLQYLLIDRGTRFPMGKRSHFVNAK